MNNQLRNILASVIILLTSEVTHAAESTSTPKQNSLPDSKSTNEVNTPANSVPKQHDSLVSDHIFSPSSPWYTPIPLEVELASNSDQLRDNLVAQKKRYYGTVKINTYQFSAPVYIAGPEVKPVTVEFNDCQKKGYADKNFLAMMSAVPIPIGAKPAVGKPGANGLPAMGMNSDYEMAIYQPSTDTYYDLWKAGQKPDGTWTACWGGKIDKASENIGTFKKFYGTTAAGFAFMAGQITAEELQRGEIRHALGFSVVKAAHWNVVSWPANRSDGWNPTKLPDQIAEGQRFRLDPTVDVDKLKMSKAGKVVAKAAQKYGFIVWDTAGALTLRANAPPTYLFKGEPDPYPELYEGRQQNAVLNNFPWDKVQFLPMDYGKP